MDAEIVNVIIAVAVIYFVVKWATSGQFLSLPSYLFLVQMLLVYFF